MDFETEIEQALLDDMVKRYVGTKLISAFPHESTPPDDGPGTAGYIVIYEDGYESWSPRGTFEAAYQAVSEGMSFGGAIFMLKRGCKVARKGWNGKNMFIFLREGRQITGVDSSTPMGGDFESCPHICMKDAQGKCVVGWLASQTDMLADDWVVVE